MKISTRALGAASTVALIFAAGSAWAQETSATAVQTQADRGSTVDEIVVTAQKREESINDVPMSIAAASGAELTKQGVTDPTQLVKLVPGFNFTPSAYGTPIYSIRGVGFLDTTASAGPTVSVYSDEVPLPFSLITLGAGLDVQRVEVLKGPQGTLFGQNATGGAINYIANKPTDEPSAGVDFSYGTFNNVDTTGFVSGPITDTLQGRIAVRWNKSGDWQKSYTRNDTLGQKDFLNGRISLAWQPTSKLNTLLTVSGWRDRSDTLAFQLYDTLPLNDQTPVDPGLTNYPRAPHDARAADWTPGRNYRRDNRFYSVSLRGDYELTDDITLTSLTAYHRFDRDERIDGDGSTYIDYEGLQLASLETMYQELRLAGTFGGKGSWLFGGNVERDNTYDHFLQTYSDSSSSSVFGLPLGPTMPVNKQGVKTWAVFANAEYPVTDTLTLIGGVRYTNQKRRFMGCGTDGGDGTWAAVSELIQEYLRANYDPDGDGVPNPMPPGHSDVAPGGCGTTGPAENMFAAGFVYDNLNEDNVSWRAGVNWAPIDGTLLYANVSKGYKAGSFPTIATSSYIQLTPATQESLLAYEVGFKSQLLDRTLQLNGAAFYYDYTDKQILGSVLDPVFGPLPALVNVPESHVVGFEVSGVWRPIDGLRISPAVSYSKSKIDGTFVNYDYFGDRHDFAGEAFPYAPEWQGSLDVQYTWPVFDGADAFVGGLLSYQGKTNAGFGQYAQVDIPSYTLLDLRAGIEKDAWRAQLWARNATDEYYWTTAGHVNDVYVRTAGMPRTFGITLSYRYQ